MIREVLPVFRAQRSGRIVNISSVVGVIAYQFNAVYASSKWALEGMCILITHKKSRVLSVCMCT